MLRLIFEGGSVGWDRILSVQRCVGTDICVWNAVFGPIIECGFVVWNRYFNVKRFVGSDF